jgi:hypothetical protein
METNRNMVFRLGRRIAAAKGNKKCCDAPPKSRNIEVEANVHYQPTAG